MSLMRDPSAKRSLGRPFLGIASLVGILFACGADTLPARGGLMVSISTDGILAPDKLKIRVDSKDQTLFRQELDLERTPLPNGLSIVSNGDETSTATIAISAFKGDVPIARRDVIVTQIPSAYVASLVVRLTASCSSFVTVDAEGDARSTCVGSGDTCIEGSCVPNAVDASTLPVFNDGEGAKDGSIDGSSDGLTSDADVIETGGANEAGADAGGPKGQLFAFVAANNEIDIYAVDAAGALTLKSTPKIVDASSFAFDPATHRVAFTRFNGTVVCLKFDPVTGNLSGPAGVSSGGTTPVHLSFDPAKKFLIVANAGGENASVFPVAAGGNISASTGAVPTGYQTSWAGFSPSGKHAFVVAQVDSLVRSYSFDNVTGALAMGPVVTISPASSPRNLAFHPSEKFVYVANEAFPTISMFAYDSATGSFTFIGTAHSESKDPNSYRGYNLVVHPNGKYLYATRTFSKAGSSSDGTSTLARFSIDANGTLALIDTVSSQGVFSRGLSLSPDGQFLFVSHQASNAISRFKIDASTGALNFVGVTPTPMPAAVGLAVFE